MSTPHIIIMAPRPLPVIPNPEKAKKNLSGSSRNPIPH